MRVFIFLASLAIPFACACDTIDIGCIGCSGGECLVCDASAGYSPVPVGVSPFECECGPHFYPDNASHDLCNACIVGCEDCDDSSSCNECDLSQQFVSDGGTGCECILTYYLDNDQCLKCSSALSGCLICSDESTCTLCDDLGNFEPSDNLCVCKVQHFFNDQGDSDKCNDTCDKCADICTSCLNANSCEQCDETKNFNATPNEDGSCSCKEGYYLDRGDSDDLSDDQCLECTGCVDPVCVIDVYSLPVGGISLTPPEVGNIVVFPSSPCSNSFTYTWTYSGRRRRLSHSPDPADLASVTNSNILVVLMHSLEACDTYDFTVTINDGYLEAVDHVVTVQMNSANPIADIAESDMDVIAGTPIDLHGGLSVDNNHPVGDQDDTSYEWTCYDPDLGGTCEIDGSTIVDGETNVDLHIPGSNVVLGTTMEISLAVTTCDGTLDSDTVVINVVDCDPDDSVDPNEEVVLEIKVPGDIISQAWTQECGPDISFTTRRMLHGRGRHHRNSRGHRSSDEDEDDDTDDDTDDDDTSIASLTILAGELEFDQCYCFRVEYTSTSGTGIEYVTIKTISDGPTCDGIEAEYITRGWYTVALVDCEETDGTTDDLLYTFSYDNGDGEVTIASDHENNVVFMRPGADAIIKGTVCDGTECNSYTLDLGDGRRLIEGVESPVPMNEHFATTDSQSSRDTV